MKSRITNFKDPLKNLSNRLRVESNFESNAYSRRSRNVKKLIGEYDLLGLFEGGAFRAIQGPLFYLDGVGSTRTDLIPKPDSYFISKELKIYLLRSVHCSNGKISLQASRVIYRNAFEFYDRRGNISFSSRQCGVFVLRELRTTLSNVAVDDVYRKLIVNASNGVIYAYTLIA